MIEKRVKGLHDEISELKEALAVKGGPAAPAGSETLAEATSLTKLESMAEQSEAALKSTRAMLRTLTYAPDRVAAQLQALAAKNPELANQFIDPATGEADYSPARMGEALAATEEALSARLAAVPARREYLAAAPKAEALAQAEHPWLKNEQDKRTMIFRQLEQSALGALLKGRTAGWKYWLGCAAETHAARLARTKSNGTAPARAPQPAAPLPKTASGGAAAGSTPRPPSPVETYRANLRAGMKPEKALELFYEQAGEPKLAREK